ncbi:MAG TPA: branched-chain amino acid ABC transporter permease [Kiloniellales bacterium]|nr:branched-chain amino acid ABC transporter permease [Kiloniellales bacterium]
MTASTLPAVRRRAGEWGWIGLAFAFLALLACWPLWSDDYGLSVVRDILVFGLLALSLDYLWGKAGVLSFGHAAFFGIGAYSMAIFGPLAAGAGANAATVGLLAGLAIAAAVAGLIGYFLLFGGVRGPYFTIVTLAVSLVAQHIAIGWSEVTGGDAGLIGAPPPGLEIGGFSVLLFDAASLYYLVLVIVTAVLLGLWVALRGRYGRALAAIQDNELRAQTLGYNTSAYLLLVFVISSALAALAGGLYASLSSYVAPDLVGLFLSTEVIVWVAVGGRGTLVGPVIGAFLVIRLQQEVSSIDFKIWPLFVGLFFVAMVFLFPRGLLPLLVQAVRRLLRSEVSR